MITRRVPPATARKGSFKRLGQYVISPVGNEPAPAGGGAGSQGALGDYITDQRRHADRVEWVRVSHCLSDSPKAAIAEINATQARNTRARSDPNYHMIVSFPPGEVPTRQQIEDIEDTLVRGLGLSEHQRISALHNDKAHLHLHVAINLIHPATLKMLHVHNDFQKRAQLAAALEVKHGLERTNHEMARERGPRTPEAAKAMEAHTGREPFVSWVRRVAGADLIAAGAGAGGWAGLHETAARYGLEIRQRGAGLVIGHADEPTLMMKPSDLDRVLSYPKLVDRLGAFEPAGDSARRLTPEQTYVRDVRSEKRQDRDLWSRYTAARDMALHDRGLASADIQAADRRYRDAVSAHYAAKFAEIKRLKHTLGIDPHIRFEALKRERAAVLARHRAAVRADRQAVRDKNPIPSWPNWLREQAAAGDRAAVTALRSMATKHERFTETLIRTPRAATQTVAALGVKPKVAGNGTTTWRLPDGGSVIETADGLTMPTASRAAAVLALEMARDRANGAPLPIAGSAVQRQALVDAAVQTRMDIEFADPLLEAERDGRIRELDRAAAPPLPTTNAETIEQFVGRRNAWPAPDDPGVYRPLSETDAGEAIFIATVRLRGAEVAIWKLGDETLVQDISGQANAVAYNLSPGERADCAAIRKELPEVIEVPADNEPAPEIDRDTEPDI